MDLFDTVLVRNPPKKGGYPQMRGFKTDSFYLKMSPRKWTLSHKGVQQKVLHG